MDEVCSVRAKAESLGLADLAKLVPMQTFDLQIGSRTWRITAACDQAPLLDYAESLEHVPYGFLLWESALALAHQLAAYPDQVRGKSVLELGAGVGLPGLVARSLGAQVWQTDHQPELFALAAANEEQNQIGGVARFVADWRTWTHGSRYDLILGADIVYERAMHPYLLRILAQNLAPGGRLLLADPGRQQGLEFAGLLEVAGWSLEMTTQRVALANGERQGQPVEVMLLDGAPPAIGKTMRRQPGGAAQPSNSGAPVELSDFLALRIGEGD